MPEKRKMEYKTYLFDFDYTLADSSRGIVICFRNVLTRHGHTDITDESIKRTIGKTLEDSFSILTGITDKNTLISYKKEYVKEADIHMTANTKFFPETVAVLKALKKRGPRAQRLPGKRGPHHLCGHAGQSFALCVRQPAHQRG